MKVSNTIELEYKAQLRTIEIDDEAQQDMLPAKLQAKGSAVS
jgi:hypothetical protein